MRAFVIAVVSEDDSDDAGKAIAAAVEEASGLSALCRALTPREVEEQQRCVRALFDDEGYWSLRQQLR